MAFGIAFLAIYIGSIVLANWLVSRYGIIPIGFGLMAPAGVFAVGVTFPCRDYIQREMPYLGIAAIIVGAGISWLISPVLAVASGATFLCSETADAIIYTPLRKRFQWAILASGTVAIVVDSLLFLKLAHIPYSVALTGQIVGKAEVLLAVGLPTAWLVRKFS